MTRAAGIDASRRAFLRGGRSGSATMRPPWAVAEAQFLERCTRCAECIRACPERILRSGDGGFPVVDFDGGECTFCEECAAVCEPRALDFTVAPPWSWSARIGDRCLTLEGIVCQSCRDACAPQAIRFPAGAAVPRPVIDAARCTGCGACLGVCPAATIRLEAGAAPSP